jgi:hypothetical protein
MANTLILKKWKYFSNKQHLHTKKLESSKMLKKQAYLSNSKVPIHCKIWFIQNATFKNLLIFQILV